MCVLAGEAGPDCVLVLSTAFFAMLWPDFLSFFVFSSSSTSSILFFNEKDQCVVATFVVTAPLVATSVAAAVAVLVGAILVSVAAVVPWVTDYVAAAAGFWTLSEAAASANAPFDAAVVSAELPFWEKGGNIRTLFNQFPPLTGTISSVTASLDVPGSGVGFRPGHVFAECSVAPQKQQWCLLPSTMTKILSPLHVSVSGMSKQLFISSGTYIVKFPTAHRPCSVHGRHPWTVYISQSRFLRNLRMDEWNGFCEIGVVEYYVKQPPFMPTIDWRRSLIIDVCSTAGEFWQLLSYSFKSQLYIHS